jgi:hypothetical protein
MLQIGHETENSTPFAGVTTKGRACDHAGFSYTRDMARATLAGMVRFRSDSGT